MDITLLPLDTPVLRALCDDPNAFARAHALDLDDHREVLHDVAAQTLALQERTGTVPPWTGYLALIEPARTVVGTCAFTGPPTADGTVEIAYFTFPAFERRGLATAMARELLAIARTSADVRAVLAHTLREPNASTAILTRLGFRCVGDAHDDDAGTVWRWRWEPPA